MKKSKLLFGVVLLPILVSGSFLQINSVKDKSVNNKDLKIIQGSTIEQVSFSTSVDHGYGGAIVNDGTNDILYTWGSNDSGQLGIANRIDQPVPVAVDVNFDGDPYNEGQLSNLTFGNRSSAVVKNNGTTATEIYTWGNNNDGQLGNDSTLPTSIPTLMPFSYNPQNGPLTIEVLDFNNNTSAMVANDSINSEVFTWGDNTYGQLGINRIGVDHLVPEAMWGPFPVGMITNFSNNGTNMLMSLNLESQYDYLYGWGNNNNGQLGLGDETNLLIPTLIKVNGTGSFASNSITQLSGDIYSTGVVIDNQLYTSGLNSSGQLGNGTQINSSEYGLVTTPTGTITDLNMRFNNSSSMIIDNQLYTWGNNNSGQLGLGDNAIRTLPTLVDTSNINGTITGLTTGSGSLMLLVNDGLNDIVYGTGRNYFNELAISTDNSNRLVLTETELRTNN